MDPGPIVYRKRILTNPAAEFIERRATIDILAQLTNSSEEASTLEQKTEFISEFDGFALKGTVFDATVYYEESQKRMEKFRATLASFVALVKERNVESDLGIVIKEPTDEGFTMDYALSIVAKIEEGPPETSSPVKTCKDFIRRCYRKVEDKRETIDQILAMVPSDIYGSVISGGFSIILAAVEKHVEQREAIQKCLAEIPEKLEKIQRLSEIHQTSRRLHARIDAVIVSIFAVLERIVNKLTDTWTYRTKKKTAGLKSMLKRHTKSSRGGSHGDGEITQETESQRPPPDNTTVADALADLETEIQRFQEEAAMCGEERLGRIEKGTEFTGHNVQSVARDTKVVKDSLAWMIARGLHKPDTSKEASRDELLIKMLDTLYYFCASDPRFNPSISHPAELLIEQRSRSSQPEVESPPEPLSPQALKKRNKKVVKSWISDLASFPYDPLPDMKDCLDHMEQLDLDERNVSQSIIASEELADWFKRHKSGVLVIESQTPQSQLVNPISFATALFATTLRSTSRFPVLAFFCMHRLISSTSARRSGPLGLVKSLNAQLLEFIRDHRPDVDLFPLQEQKLMSSKSRTDLSRGLSLLEALISLLPEGDTVYIMIDCHSQLAGSEKDGNKVIKRLGKIISRTADRNSVDIKVLITDPLVGSSVIEIADVELHVQDLIAGSGVIDAEGVLRLTEKKRNDQRKKKTKKKGRKRVEESERSDSETESEEDSD